MSGERPFDEYALRYDRWFDENPGIFSAQVSGLRAMLPRTGRSLEIGTGSGRFAAALGIVHGVDPSFPLLTLARQREIRAVQGRVECLPYRSGSFDSVLMMAVICFISRPGPAFSEVYRVLLPGGILVLGFFERDGAIGLRARRQDPPGRFFSHAVFRTLPEVKEYLSLAHLRVCTVHEDPEGFCCIRAKKTG
ncbi:MAG: class I SAM-dependent methyltransferase [Methanoregula sp.]|nr:class I SAM-dependent methyltransferase [Methanoregula sp.]